MRTCLFLSFRFSLAPVSASEMARLDEVLRMTPKLQKALVHSSANARDPYVKDESPPQLVLQLYFDDVADLEATLSRDGHIGILASRDEFPSIATAEVVQQAMIVRPFAVPEPAFQNARGTPYCTYLVSY